MFQKQLRSNPRLLFICRTINLELTNEKHPPKSHPVNFCRLTLDLIRVRRKQHTGGFDGVCSRIRNAKTVAYFNAVSKTIGVADTDANADSDT